MKRRHVPLACCAAWLAIGQGLGPSPASAQTFQTFLCADGSQFSTAFFNADTRAFLQLDGRPVTLARRVAVSGKRYAGSGVTLTITRAGLVLLRHGKLPVTSCTVQ